MAKKKTTSKPQRIKRDSRTGSFGDSEKSIEGIKRRAAEIPPKKKNTGSK